MDEVRRNNLNALIRHLSRDDRSKIDHNEGPCVAPVEVYRLPSYEQQGYDSLLYVMYETESGRIRPLDRAARDGEVSLVELSMDKGRILFEQDGRLNQALTLLGHDVSSLTESRMRVVPIRLNALGADASGFWPSERIHEGNPQRFGTHEGDRVLIDTVIDYNVYHVHTS